MAKWVIVKLSPGAVQMLNKSGVTFTENINDAAVFETDKAATLVASTLKTSTLIHCLDEDTTAVSKNYFPKPDYFECSPELMSLTELVEMIRANDLLEFFTPVDKITGARQMTGGGISDPITGRIAGRYYQFSFDKCLSDTDADELHHIVALTESWDSVEYRRIRLGFTEYAVLTLKVKMP